MGISSVKDWFCIIVSGNLDLVRENLEVCAGARSKRGDTGLMVAARYDLIEIVRLLAPKEHGLRNKDGYTALFVAINYDCVSCVEILAHYEAYLPIKDNLTALHYAVVLNRLSCLSPLILALGHERDDSGRTATDLAFLMGHLDATIALLRRGYRCTPTVSSASLLEHIHQLYKYYSEASAESSD